MNPPAPAGDNGSMQVLDRSPLVVQNGNAKANGNGTGPHDGAWSELDPSWMMQRVADQVHELVAPADAVLIGLVDERRTLRFVVGAGRLENHAGFTMPIEGSLSGLAVESCEVVVSDDAFDDERANANTARRLDTRATVCVPLVRERRAIGVLNVASARPAGFGDQDVEILREMADFASVVIGAIQDIERVASSLIAVERRLADAVPDGEVGDSRRRQFVSSVLGPRGTELTEARGQIEELLATRALRTVFQPVIDLANGRLVAVEALSRFDLEPRRPPDQWFALARRIGLGDELELLAIERALEAHADLGPHVRLAVNASPALICTEAFVDVIRNGRPSHTVVEITEHESVTSYQALAESIRRLREDGVHFAVDDTGSGISSLAHVLRLAPEYIKFDRELTTGIEVDPARRALAEALSEFARKTNVRIIAEGIETREQLDILRGTGIEEGQGFYFSPGVPLDKLQPHYLMPV